MYVITHNDQVLLGPVIWNPRYINDVILDDTEIITNILLSDKANVPMDLGNGLKIRHATEFRPSLNPKIQMHNGPFWTFTESTGLASFVVLDKPMSLVKQELKAIVADVRFVKEAKGTTAVVQGVTVSIDTSREKRAEMAIQYLLLAAAGTILWKFPQGWVTLNRGELLACITASSAHIQASFATESAVTTQIEAATTLAALNTIVLGNEPVIGV